MQRQLFDTSIDLRTADQNAPGLHHRDARDTEKAAALAIVPASGTQRYIVLEAIAHAGERGITDWELVAVTALLRSSICARRNELMRDNFVRDSGRRRTEQTGSKAICWVATDRGKQAVGVA